MTKRSRKSNLKNGLLKCAATFAVATFAILALSGSTLEFPDSEQYLNAEEPIANSQGKPPYDFRLKIEEKDSANEEKIAIIPLDKPEDEIRYIKTQWMSNTTETDETEFSYTDDDVTALAQMAYGEAWGTGSDTEMSQTMWCVLNRLDSNDSTYASLETPCDVITQSGQFHGYDPGNPVEERLASLAIDVLERWIAEKNGDTDVGRTLPSEYTFFWGDGLHNHYTTEYQGGVEYDGRLGTPYCN